MESVDIVISFKLAPFSSINPNKLAGELKEILEMSDDISEVECNIRVEQQ